VSSAILKFQESEALIRVIAMVSRIVPQLSNAGRIEL